MFLKRNGGYMATQGMVSILKNGETFIKIVVGCDGYNIDDFCQEIINKKTVNLTELYYMALKCDFGCGECLVVMNEEKILHPELESIDWSLYRNTFHNSNFNPRWESGITEYFKILNVEDIV